MLGAGFLRCAEQGLLSAAMASLVAGRRFQGVGLAVPRHTGSSRPGVEPTAPALASGLLAAGPPGQSSSRTPCKTRLMSAFLNMKVIFVHFKIEGKLEDGDPVTHI